MNAGKILLIKMGKGRFGPVVNGLLANQLVSKFKLAAMKRGEMPADQRRDFFLYVDEAHNLPVENFMELLYEARKYRLAVEPEEAIWNDLRGQCILGGEKFLQWIIPKLKEKAKIYEVPSQQRYADRPPLSELLPAFFPSKSARKEVIVRAYRDHGYFQTAIAKEAGLDYSTVSRIISRGWPCSKDKTLTPHPWQLNFGTIDILYLTAHDHGGFHSCTEEPGSTMHSLLQKIHRSGNWPTFEHMSGKKYQQDCQP
ncbi:MAG: hypothetical protein U5L00_19950 [Desulfovermiculus sp.]|nr:hypothetical protein [Desulfovermiculus sp.]